jgi:hypothetical protein
MVGFSPIRSHTQSEPIKNSGERRRIVYRLTYIFLALVLCVVLIKPAAAEFDGSKPLLCAVIDVFECGPENGCLESTAEGINIPQFIRIDFENKKASGTLASGEIREVGIERMERESGAVVIQGGQLGRGWSVSIREETGKMTLAASGDRFGFVIFGACTSP